MANPLEPRGPLPARVYWTRRLLVLGVALALVVVVAKVLGGGSDASSDGEDQAARMSAEPSGSTTAAAPPRVRARTASPEARPARTRRTRPARPDGPCAENDILAVPKVRTAEAGRDVRITVGLRTRVSEACTWTVSPDTLTLSITSGKDDIWSSRECPNAVPTRDVVVRRASATPLEIVWDARRSDEECSKYTEWAMMGYYHVEAAALAGEPTDVQFELVRPVRGTVTRTVTPKPRPRTGKARPAEQDESTRHRAGDDGGGNSEG